MSISRIIEELFPFGHYLANSHCVKKRLCDSSEILCRKEFVEYRTLSVQQLKKRLKEEHKRASDMDAKTFKLTLSFSVGLTILGSIAAFFIKMISFSTIQTILTVLIGLGVFYVLAAGLLAVGALRTRPSYGYGTRPLLWKKKKKFAEALAHEETMNITRHIRNEAAYQSLRNGLWLLFLGLLIFATTFAYQHLKVAC
ncbi:MAG: hypothetical protein OXJ38_01685 [Gammaproteobacteria bacterium]|nr:hypothetical protein [Gammaproteobacteria bacterium]